MRHGSHAGTENYLNILYAHGIIPSITEPTRFGKNTSTLIDNLLINKPSIAFISGLLLTDISDHLPIFYIANSIINSSTPKFKTILRRTINDSSITKLKATLNQTTWTSLYEVTDANAAYKHFTDVINCALNHHMPETKKLVKNYSFEHKPWITSGITKYIRHKNNLYTTYLRNKSTRSNNKYKNYNNKLTNTIRAAEKMYYHAKF